MATENCKTIISKQFTLSEYYNGRHIIEGLFSHKGNMSFSESLCPLSLMIESFRYRPLGTKIKVTMEEVN